MVASNRGPVSFDRDDRGRLAARRGSGGLVTALSGVFYRDDTTWVSSAMTDGRSRGGPEGPDGGSRFEPAHALRRDAAGALRRLLQRDLEPDPVVRPSRPVGHPPLADVRRRHRGRLVRLHRDQPRVRQRPRRRSRPRPRLPDPGLPPEPGARHAAGARARGQDRALLAHAVRRCHVPPRPAGRHADRAPARARRRRRAGLPVQAVGGELPAVGAEPARVPRPAGWPHADRGTRRRGARVPGGGERRAAARDGGPTRGRRGARGAPRPGRASAP